MSIKKNVLASSPDTIFQRDEVRQIAVKPSCRRGPPHGFRDPRSAASKSGGARMTVSKLFKSSEGCEMVQCTWFWCRGRDAMMESAAVRLRRFIARIALEQAFNETRVAPVS